MAPHETPAAGGCLLGKRLVLVSAGRSGTCPPALSYAARRGTCSDVTPDLVGAAAARHWTLERVHGYAGHFHIVAAVGAGRAEGVGQQTVQRETPRAQTASLGRSPSLAQLPANLFPPLQGRAASRCGARYLGAARACAARHPQASAPAGAARVGLYSKNDRSAVTAWELVPAAPLHE